REGTVGGELVEAFAGRTSGRSRLDGLCQLLRAGGATGVRLAIDPPALDTELASRLGLDRHVVVELGANADAAVLRDALAGESALTEVVELEAVGRAHAVPGVNDPLFPNCWHLANTGQPVFGTPGLAGADVRATRAWAVARTSTSTPVTVAVLDTGVSQSHPDLAGAMVTGRNFLSSTFPLAYDDTTTISHGTYCAGIVAATANNAIGVAGGAPAARIMPVRILNSSRTGTQTTCAGAVTWAADQGAGVISMSLGWGTASTTGVLNAAIAYAAARGVVMCASVGNEPGGTIGYPASDPAVIAVGGTDNRDQAFSGGTTGAAMSLSAPAVGVFTTTDDSTAGLDGYAPVDGTSMACPIAAAGAALVRSINPTLTGAQVRTILESTADDLGAPGRDPVFGFGRVNFEAAARSALATLPCRADADGSGSLTIADLTQMLSWFFAGDPRADIDASLAVSVDDIFLFLRMWFAGCSVGP
ncbi:MAG: S8 family serine peptidase, partial [Phycisphaerales bacterium]|nr:S8 family serine peptidase [Phycisphaerales bacterium]